MGGRIKNFIFGKVSFCAAEGFCELFLRECRRKGILLYEIKRTDDSISGYVSQMDVKQLFECAAESGMRVEIISRRGLPDTFIRYRKRAGLPVGLFLFAVILLLLRSFVWSVDIQGLERIPADKLEETLASLGVSEGVFCESINCKDIEFSLYKMYDDISWVSVSIVGARCFVSISEVKAQEEYKEDIYSNIIAAKDGEIVRADIFSGEGELFKGTAVVKGDLLVSGIRNHRDGSVEFVDSNAVILARTRNFITSTVPEELTVSVIDTCKDNYFAGFFGLRFPMMNNIKEYNFTESRYCFRSGDVVYPIFLSRIHKYTLNETKISLSEGMAMLIAFRDFSFRALKLYSKAEVLEADITASFTSSCEISGKFLCEEDIAQKKSFTVEETNRQ